jgi:hypothetical protein
MEEQMKLIPNTLMTLLKRHLAANPSTFISEELIVLYFQMKCRFLDESTFCFEFD